MLDQVAGVSRERDTRAPYEFMSYEPMPRPGAKREDPILRAHNTFTQTYDTNEWLSRAAKADIPCYPTVDLTMVTDCSFPLWHIVALRDGDVDTYGYFDPLDESKRLLRAIDTAWLNDQQRYSAAWSNWTTGNDFVVSPLTEATFWHYNFTPRVAGLRLLNRRTSGSINSLDKEAVQSFLASGRRRMPGEDLLEDETLDPLLTVLNAYAINPRVNVMLRPMLPNEGCWALLRAFVPPEMDAGNPMYIKVRETDALARTLIRPGLRRLPIQGKHRRNLKEFITPKIQKRCAKLRKFLTEDVGFTADFIWKIGTDEVLFFTAYPSTHSVLNPFDPWMKNRLQ